MGLKVHVHTGLIFLAVAIWCAPSSSQVMDGRSEAVNSTLRSDSSIQIAQTDSTELAFWESVKNSDDPAELRAYIDRYPEGHFTTLARLRMNKLQGAATNVQAEATPAASPQNGASSSPPPVHECDQLASAVDLARIRDSASDGGVDTGIAATVCRKAIEAHPGEARFEFQLGRVLAAAQAFQEAAQWYRKAADRGHAAAQTELGLLFTEGLGVAQDDGEAVRWYRQAAEQGFGWAQAHLGLMYAIGRGVARDDSQAVQWYRKSAELGFAWAQAQLGSLFDQGRGVARDHVQAAKWYALAAEQGHAGAQSSLGQVYATGRGVAKNLAVAIYWSRKAALQGDEYAQTNLEILGVSMDQASAIEIEAVQEALTKLGYGPTPADGSVGPKTEAAIEAYQRDRELPVDGTVTLELVARVLGVDSVEPPSVSTADQDDATTPQSTESDDLDTF